MTRQPLTEDEKRARREAAAKAKELETLRIIASHSQSMTKHALIVQAFGGYIVNFFAYLNVAVFTAFTAYLSTSIGQNALEEYYKYCIFTYVCIILGLVLSLGLMASVTHYSRTKFDHYRSMVDGLDSKGDETFKIISFIVVAFDIPVTVFGAAFATGIILVTHVAQKASG